MVRGYLTTKSTDDAGKPRIDVAFDELGDELFGDGRLHRGQVLVDGTAMSALDDDAATRLRRTRMGFIFQAFHVLPHLTLRQNVALPLLLNREIGRAHV